MKIAATLGEDCLNMSIQSCAAPNSEKFVRKLLLRDIIKGREIVKGDLSEFRLLKKHKFGTSFGVDILTMYFFWKLGKDFVLENLADIEQLDISELYDINMRFFENYNQANLPAIPPDVRGQIIDQYEKCGIFKYDESDLRNFELCKQYLKRLHAKKYL